MLERILSEVFEHYGFLGFVMVTSLAMLSASVAQIVQLRRWTPQTERIIQEIGVLISNQSQQHSQCLLHYEYVKRLTDDMRSLTNELSRLAENIQSNHMLLYKEMIDVLRSKNRETD